MNRIIPSGGLLNDKSILFIEIQPFHQRQAIGRSRKIERELLRSQAFCFHKALRESLFFEAAQQHIIRQEMSISSLYNRVYGQRVSPESILARTFFHGRDNDGIIKSYDFRRLGELEILVGIHQSINTVFTRSNSTDRKSSAAIRTTYTIERQRRESRIGQIGMQADQHTFYRFQIRRVKQRAGNSHRIELRTGRKRISKALHRISFIIILDSIGKVDSICGISLQRILQVDHYPLAVRLYFRLLHLRR